MRPKLTQEEIEYGVAFNRELGYDITPEDFVKLYYSMP